MKQRTIRALLMMLALLVALAPAQPAAAQVRVSANASGSFQTPINRRSVESYARILRLDEDQKQAAMALYQGYRAGVRQIREETNKLMKEIQEEFTDSMDPSVYKDIGKKFEPLTKRSQDLEKQFFADVQTLLTPDQEARMPKLERFRRRETNMRFSMVAGARVDLIEIAERLELAEASPSVVESLESYELSLDRALSTRETTMQELEKESEKIAEQAANMDFSSINDMMKKMLEADKPLRELNKTYARRISEALPEEKQAAFDREFKLRSFPQVYREPHVRKELEAALKLDDLSESQRTELEQIRKNYDRESAALNQRWAAAIEEKDDKGIVPWMAFMGGGSENPTTEPRKARRELDKQASSKLRSLLNETQVAKLPEAPKRSQQEEMMEAMGMDMDPDMMPGEDGWALDDDED